MLFRSQTAVYLNGLSSSDKMNTLQKDGAGTVIYQGTMSGAPLLIPGSATTNAVIDAVVKSGNGRRGSAWEAPTYDAVPDPAGPNWTHDLASQPDSTAYIQGLINAATPGVAILPAGKYYISRPLVMTGKQGLIDAGMDKTVIIAKNSSIDMIVGGDHLEPAFSYLSFTLSDLTLQGGLNGVHHDASGSGGGAGYYLMFLSQIGRASCRERV